MIYEYKTGNIWFGYDDIDVCLVFNTETNKYVRPSDEMKYHINKEYCMGMRDIQNFMYFIDRHETEKWKMIFMEIIPNLPIDRDYYFFLIIGSRIFAFIIQMDFMFDLYSYNIKTGKIKIIEKPNTESK